jgi:hypothetical protein
VTAFAAGAARRTIAPAAMTAFMVVLIEFDLLPCLVLT